MTKQIKCIVKRGGHYNPHERIQAVGGYDNGMRWKDTEEAAIANVERDSTSYYVSVNGKSVWVVVAVSRAGRKYLKTMADDYEPNNLLALPDCP